MGLSMYDYISGDVAAYFGSVLDVCMSQFEGRQIPVSLWFKKSRNFFSPSPRT
jgi:hypothetical protein